MTKPLFDVFRDTMMTHATSSRKEAQDAFVERMKADPAYTEILARFYFDLKAANWTVRAASPMNTAFVHTETALDKLDRAKPAATVALVQRSREEAAARSAAAFSEMKAKLRSIVLLDLMLPDGKALRDATGAECVRAGGFFAAVGKAIKPTQVVDRHLRESDLQNIRARFYQANEAA